MRKIVPLASALALLATSLNAGAHLPGRCQGLSTEQDGDADRAFQCIADLELELEKLAGIEAAIADMGARLAAMDIAKGIKPVADRVEALETQLGDLNAVPAIGPHPETRAVVAFVSDKGEKTCPRGWSPFEAAKDRFIIGAGGKYATVGGIGGEEKVTLSVAQMPEHSHGYRSTDNGTLNDNRSNFAGGARRFGTVGPKTTSSAGKSQPHNNIPPYIALYFCKKD